jgi:hypothetical protein
MRVMEIELGRAVFQARLLEDRAPRTCQALWEALPFEGRAVHAMWSGNMCRTLDAAPIDVEAVESGLSFQYPGLVVYYPPRREIAVCYGDARFRGSAGAAYVTPIAEVLGFARPAAPALAGTRGNPTGDLDALAESAARLQFEGATPIRFRRSETVLPAPTQTGAGGGTPIEIDLDGSIVTATLLEASAPRTCAAFKRLLPLEGRALNTKWSGAMLHFWRDAAPPGTRGSVGLEVDPLEHPTHFHWPGYIYYYPEWSGIRIPYGDAQMSGAFRVCDMTAFARFEGDWSPFRDTASQLYLTGARPMRIRSKG